MVPSTTLSTILSIVHLSLLYSLYSFEYKWCNMGMELNNRLALIENCWPYFLGFGLPLAIITSLPESYFIRYDLLILKLNNSTHNNIYIFQWLLLFNSVPCVYNQC